jgi:hypothetical protein
LTRQGGFGFGSPEANIALARLDERRNEPRAALQALDRRVYHPGVGVYFRPYTSTLLREEGRVARQLGDRTRAVRAYSQYLALRTRPEPSLAPEVAEVCAELHTLDPTAHAAACGALAAR